MSSDYRSMFDREYIGAWDLENKDVTVTIARVEAKELVGSKGVKAKKPIVYFEGTAKGLACNKTNGKTIAGMYGNDTAHWIGKRVTLYATTTSMGSDTVECIRVRPGIPPDTSAKKEAPRAAAS